MVASIAGARPGCPGCPVPSRYLVTNVKNHFRWVRTGRFLTRQAVQSRPVPTRPSRVGQPGQRGAQTRCGVRAILSFNTTFIFTFHLFLFYFCFFVSFYRSPLQLRPLPLPSFTCVLAPPAYTSPPMFYIFLIRVTLFTLFLSSSPTGTTVHLLLLSSSLLLLLSIFLFYTSLSVSLLPPAASRTPSQRH